MPRKLSEHFTLEEMVLSQTAARKNIDNTPTPAIVANLRLTVATLEEIRTRLKSEKRLKSGTTSIWRFYERHDITFKKNSARS